MSGATTEITGPDNLVDIFEQAVERFKDNNLFGTKNKTGTAYDWVTYGEVAKRVDNLRAASLPSVWRRVMASALSQTTGRNGPLQPTPPMAGVPDLYPCMKRS